LDFWDGWINGICELTNDSAESILSACSFLLFGQKKRTKEKATFGQIAPRA
jgi:hypothetical protein